MVLALKSSDGVDFDHAGHLSQLGADDPILNLAQRHSIVGSAIRLHCTRQGIHRVDKNLPQAGRNRPHHRLQSRRQRIADAGQALIDQVAGVVNVCTFAEHHRHLRQTIARQRAGVLQARQAIERGFHRKGNPLFGL